MSRKKKKVHFGEIINWTPWKQKFFHDVDQVLITERKETVNDIHTPKNEITFSPSKKLSFSYQILYKNLEK